MPYLQAVREDECVTLRGHLEDTANLSGLESHFSDASVIDLSKLYSVSWVGIQTLVSFLQAQKKKFSISACRPDLFRILCMFPDLSDVLTPGSFDWERRDSTGQVSTCPVSADELCRLASMQGRFVRTETGESFFGAIPQILGPFDIAVEPELRVQSEWLSANKSDYLFFYDYASFLFRNIESASVSISATMVLSEEMLHQIVEKTRSANSLYSAIFSKDERYSMGGLSEAIEGLQEITNTTLSVFKKKTAAIQELIFEFQNLTCSTTTSQLDVAKAALQVFREGHDLKALTSVLDQTGSRGSGIATSFSFVSEWYQRLTSMNSSEMTDKQKNNVVRRLSLEEFNLDVVQESLAKEKDLFENLIARCIITLQQFDVLRQVCEHRVSECQVLINALSAAQDKQPSIQALRSEVLSMASEKLVTDIERFSFDFFFPGERAHRHGTVSDSGDVFFL